MRSSESITTLVPALIAARRQFAAVVKLATGQVGQDRTYRYADWAGIVDAVMPGCLDNGIVVFQIIDPETATLITRLVHVSGEWVESRYPLKLDLSPQAFGSLLTYGKRYSLQSLLCLAAEDDDGAAADVKPAATKKKAAPVGKLPPTGDAISEPQRKRLFAVASKSGWTTEAIKDHLRLHFGITSTKDMPAAKYDLIVSTFAVPPVAPEELPL